MAKKITIGLIYGGKSAERNVSLRTAEQIKRSLDKKKYQILPIEISATGAWPKKVSLAQLKKSIDLALVAMHGPYGEDGTVQGLLEMLDIPYTFSGVLASALAMDKYRTGLLAKQSGLVIPKTVWVSKEAWQSRQVVLLKNVRDLGKRIVVKPNLLGSSLGVQIIVNKPLLVRAAIQQTFKHSDEVLVQEWIQGIEITAGVLGNREPKPLPLIEIIPTTRSGMFYDYQAKYADGGSEHIIPARLSKKITQDIQNSAITVHDLLGCRGVTRSDFIVTNSGKIYFLEINTIPGMTSTSLVPQAAAAAGISFPQLLDRIIGLAKR